MVEIVCVSVGSFPVSTGGQTVFLKRLDPTVAKKVFIRFAFSSSRTARVLSSLLIGPVWGLLFGFVASESTFQYAAVEFAESIFSRKKLAFARKRWRYINVDEVSLITLTKVLQSAVELLQIVTA